MIFETTTERWEDSIRVIFPDKVVKEMDIKAGERVLVDILNSSDR